jgi:hypothetical protein
VAESTGESAATARTLVPARRRQALVQRALHLRTLPERSAEPGNRNLHPEHEPVDRWRGRLPTMREQPATRPDAGRGHLPERADDPQPAHRWADPRRHLDHHDRARRTCDRSGVRRRPGRQRNELTDGWLSAGFRAVDPGRSRYVQSQLLQPWHPFTQQSLLPVDPGTPSRKVRSGLATAGFGRPRPREPGEVVPGSSGGTRPAGPR